MRDVLGIPPIHPAVLVPGKVGFVVSWAVLGLRLAGVDLLGVTFEPARWPAAAALALGALAVGAGLARLDEAARIGLPSGETRLKTTGLYAYSRNPVYAGALLVCLASSVYVPHWLNILATLTATLVHHRIVLAEERFLRQRFGGAYDEYRARVRRYL